MHEDCPAQPLASLGQGVRFREDLEGCPVLVPHPVTLHDVDNPDAAHD